MQTTSQVKTSCFYSVHSIILVFVLFYFSISSVNGQLEQHITKMQRINSNHFSLQLLTKKSTYKGEENVILYISLTYKEDTDIFNAGHDTSIVHGVLILSPSLSLYGYMQCNNIEMVITDSIGRKFLPQIDTSRYFLNPDY